MRRSALLAVCLAVFVDMLGFGIILPLLPFHVQRLGGGGVWVGSLLTAYSAAQFVAAPVLGALSDRYGRRRLLLVSLLGSMVSLALTGVAGSLLTLLSARVVSGAFGGAIAVGQAYAADLTQAKGRTRALGLVGASIGLGFVFGPGIGAGLAALGLGFTGACLVASGLAALNIAVGLVLLPRTTRGHRIRLAGGVSRLATLNSAVQDPRLRPALLAIFSVAFAFVGMETTFALLGAQRFGLGPAGLGLIFAGVGVVMVAVQGGLVGRVTDRWGERRVAVLGALLLALGLGALPLVPAVPGYLALGVVAVGQGLVSTTTAALIAHVGGRRVGGAFGLSQSAAAAARAAGPLVAGAAFDVRAFLPYFVGAMLCIAAMALLNGSRNDTRSADGSAPDSRAVAPHPAALHR